LAASVLECPLGRKPGCEGAGQRIGHSTIEFCDTSRHSHDNPILEQGGVDGWLVVERRACRRDEPTSGVALRCKCANPTSGAPTFDNERAGRPTECGPAEEMVR